MKNKKITYINFMGPVNERSATQLITTVNQKLNEGANNFVLLISSPGGSVFYGLSAYNFLKGVPAKIHTHNFGSVDSVALLLFCAGTKRFCVPNARFLLHGIGFDVPPGGARFEEKQVDERLKSLRIDRENISKIIADNCKKTVKEVEKDMFEGTVLNPQQAKEYGVVHEIKSDLFEPGAEVINITPIPIQPIQSMPQMFGK